MAQNARFQQDLFDSKSLHQQQISEQADLIEQQALQIQALRKQISARNDDLVNSQKMANDQLNAQLLSTAELVNKQSSVNFQKFENFNKSLALLSDQQKAKFQDLDQALSKIRTISPVLRETQDNHSKFLESYKSDMEKINKRIEELLVRPKSSPLPKIKTPSPPTTPKPKSSIAEESVSSSDSEENDSINEDFETLIQKVNENLSAGDKVLVFDPENLLYSPFKILSRYRTSETRKLEFLCITLNGLEQRCTLNTEEFLPYPKMLARYQSPTPKRRTFRRSNSHTLDDNLEENDDRFSGINVIKLIEPNLNSSVLAKKTDKVSDEGAYAPGVVIREVAALNGEKPTYSVKFYDGEVKDLEPTELLCLGKEKYDTLIDLIEESKNKVRSRSSSSSSSSSVSQSDKISKTVSTGHVKIMKILKLNFIFLGHKPVY